MKKAINILMAAALLSTCAAAPLSTFAAEVSVSEAAIPSCKMKMIELYTALRDPSENLDSKYETAALDDVLTQICGDYVATCSYDNGYYLSTYSNTRLLMSPDLKVHLIHVIYPEVVVEMKEGAELPASDIEAAVKSTMPTIQRDGNLYRIRDCYSKEYQFDVIMDILQKNRDVRSITGHLAVYEDTVNGTSASYGTVVGSPSGMGIDDESNKELLEAAAAFGFKADKYNLQRGVTGEYDIYLYKDSEAAEIKQYEMLKYLSENGCRYAVPIAVTEMAQESCDVYFCNISYPVSNVADVKKTPAADEKSLLKGDANCDGGVDMADVVFIMQSLANPDKYKLTDIGRVNADMDGDGVTVADAQAIQAKLLGLDKKDNKQADEPPVSEDAGLTTAGGKKVTFGLSGALRNAADTGAEVAVSPKYGTDYNYVYNGKTVAQYLKEWDEHDSYYEKYGQIFKDGDKLKYGEALYTTGTPDGEKWDKNWYDTRVAFYGEDFLAKYIVDGEFLRDKAEADQAEFLEEARTTNYCYTVSREAIDAYNAEMMQATIPQLEAQNIRYEYANGGKELVFYVTAAQFEELSLDNAASYGLASSGKAEDMGMDTYVMGDV
ncbi:MAG: dockerin type I repeat-containing protein [Ruminococcus sp.]|uniref:dockerin type I repeat-containing protein n=1 Tax=Ruminococcus sp. TaxID=41978 RepID=UPI002A00FA08|nr:dockerin type I repeat-containing protein [Ruminococcus sp.]